jgi:hypothetical protein
MVKQEKGNVNCSEIRELIEVNLFPDHTVTTEMAWNWCKHLGFNYNRVAQMFRVIMYNLIQEGKAVKMVNGRYLILKHK